MVQYQRSLLEYMDTRARKGQYIHRPTKLKKKLGFTEYLWIVLSKLVDKEKVGKCEARDGLKGSYYYLIDYEKKAKEEMLRKGLIDEEMLR